MRRLALAALALLSIADARALPPVLPSSCTASDNAHLTDACQGSIASALVSAMVPRL